jgi:hypothetical protein
MDDEGVDVVEDAPGRIRTTRIGVGDLDAAETVAW